MNAQLRQIGRDRCVVPVKKPAGMFQYFVFKGHQNTYLDQKKLKAEVRVSEQDSEQCAAQLTSKYEDLYQVVDEEVLPGLKHYFRLLSLNLNNKRFY